MDIRVRADEYGIYASYKEGMKLALAEASYAPMFNTINSSKDVLYFNRIIVPNGIRQKGIGTKLLKALLREAVNRNAAILCEINPYGDLSYDQLKDWYIRHGFKEVANGELWYNL